MNTMFKTLILSLPLVACGGGGSGNSEPNTDYSKLKQDQIEPGPLRQASASELSELVKNGLRLSLHGDVTIQTALINTLSSNKTAGNFSRTNIQTAGVDEADTVKYDGKYIYLSTPIEYIKDTPKTSLKIFATNTANASTTQVSDTALDTTRLGDVAEMYLINGTQGTHGLATIRSSWEFITLANKVADASIDGKPDKALIASILPHRMHNGIDITIYDVRTAMTPTKTWSLSIDGHLLGTRKIGNTLYVISRFIPGISTLNYVATTKGDKITNEQLIAQTSIENLLPTYSINGGAQQLLTSANGCLVSANTDQYDSSLTLTNVTAINLDSQQLVGTQCVNGNVDGIYSSTENLYLSGSEGRVWENWRSYTVIHKFAFANGGVDYSATGSVEGTLGWRSPSFRMDEHRDYLRIVTSTYNEGDKPTHQLYFLKKVSGRSELEVVATLPNQIRPEPIGKPREDIFGVRFNGDKAYIVTFERKDPLYVLDLTTPTDPKIAGQLEIPGFSTYLHPIGDNYLFALGNETDSKGFANGVKVSLYDIRNPANPTEISKHVFGTALSWSDALYNHHALSFLQTNNDQIRITLPISLYENVSMSEYITRRWVNEGLYQFEINGLANNKASLDHLGTVIGEDASQQEFPRWYGNDRSFLHDNALFYVHGPNVIGTPWGLDK